MSENTTAKICLISLESKRTLNFAVTSCICEKFASFGYYFDKVIRIAYDDSRGIVEGLKTAKDEFTDVFIVCPHSMSEAVKRCVSELYGAEFDALLMLSVGNRSVFIHFYDAENKLGFDDIKAIFDKKYAVEYARTYIRACAPDGAVDEAIACAQMERDFATADARLNVYRDYGDCRIELVYSSRAPKIYIDGIIRTIVTSLGDYVYALEDITIAEQLYRLLKLRRMKISVAESFTGGGISKSLVKVPGVSEVYFEGINAYANEAKIARLSVKELTLKQYGAVSAETAYEMAEGLLLTGNCDIAISTTGIAGPKSDNTQKPVGLAYIGIGVEGDIAVYKFNFGGDREAITRAGINQALYLAYKKLK